MRSGALIWSRAPSRIYLITSLVIAVVYFVAARAGLAIGHISGQVSVIWPASAIALTMLLLLGWQYWPGIYVGAFAANATFHEPLLVAVGIAAGNVIEALIGWGLLTYVFKFRNKFLVPMDVLAFGLAALASTFVGAAVGATCLMAGGIIAHHGLATVGRAWWIGDLAGDIVFGPFILSYLDKDAFKILTGRVIEGGIILATIFLAAVILLTIHRPLLFLLFPLVIWAALRLAQLGVVSSIIIITTVAIWAALRNLGPFVSYHPLTREFVALQVYVSVLSATSLIVAMAIAERINAENDLSLKQKELERLEGELRDANKRMTNILTGILEETSPRRSRKADSQKNGRKL